MTTKKQILSFLKTVEGTGSFETSGVDKFSHPGLHIEGIGEVGFPLNPIIIKEIIKIAQQAPFGKGSQTITDTTVRNTWEIDSAQVSFQNKDWDSFLKKILKKVKAGLGIEEHKISANLYKLLIYEEGGFFLPHKDSEKEKGMFATLTVGLPSEHTGGELFIRFDGQEELIDFSTAASNYKIPYAAFYADCEHEVKPVTSGYRINLVYNLVQKGGAEPIKSHRFGDRLGELEQLLSSMKSSFVGNPKAILLGHQYTPSNYSINHLKHHDYPRAQLLLQAAENTGYFARLGLLTHYLMGDLEGGYDDYYSYRSRRYSSEPEEETMGDVHEMSTTIENWGEGGDTPALGMVGVDEHDIITDMPLGNGEPIEKESEGYTGNAGMTMEYWYHYGAVILWPKSQHSDLLYMQPTSVRLNWLDFYTKNWDDEALNSKEYTQQLVKGFAIQEINKERYSYNDEDYSPVINALIKINDVAFLQKEGYPLLVKAFELIKPEYWVQLVAHFSPDLFHSIFEAAGTTENVDIIHHLLKVLQSISALQSPSSKAFVLKQTQNLSQHLQSVNLQKTEEARYYYSKDESRQETIKAIIEKILDLSINCEQDQQWLDKMVTKLTSNLPRPYVNKVLCPILASNKYNERLLAKKLFEASRADLEFRTSVKPSPPADWKRKVPKSQYYQAVWDLLRPFLESPTQQTFDYVKNQSERSTVESAIKNAKVDLKTETIRKGRPYTLRITKNQAAYKEKLKEWKQDVKLLKELNALSF